MSDSLQNKILDAIKSGEVKSRPKWYFYAQSALFAGGVLLAALILLFLSSLIVFSLRQNGGWFAPGFGLTGLKIFFGAIPWLLLLAAGAVLWLLEYMLKHYKFTYRRPLLYSFVGVGLLAAVGTFLASSAHFHEELMERSRGHKRMFGAPLYQRYGNPRAKNVTRGEVTLKTDYGCEIKTLEEEGIKVYFTPQTRVPEAYKIMVGDIIIVLGPRKGNEIEAFGIKRLDDNFEKVFPPPIMPRFVQ